MSDFQVNYRKHRVSVNHPAFSPRSSQVESTNQVVSVTGAAVAIRPKKTYIRYMDTKGTGTVAYV